MLGGELLDKFCVAIAGTCTELMIEMTGDKIFVAGCNEPMQQRDRIAPDGHADEITPVRRKRAQKNFILNQIQRDLASNVRRMITRVELRQKQGPAAFQGEREI